MCKRQAALPDCDCTKWISREQQLESSVAAALRPAANGAASAACRWQLIRVKPCHWQEGTTLVQVLFPWHSKGASMLRWQSQPRYRRCPVHGSLPGPAASCMCPAAAGASKKTAFVHMNPPAVITFVPCATTQAQRSCKAAPSSFTGEAGDSLQTCACASVHGTLDQISCFLMCGPVQGTLQSCRLTAMLVCLAVSCPSSKAQVVVSPNSVVASFTG